jgi:hypothetical protein
MSVPAAAPQCIPFEAGVTTEAPLFANMLPKPVKEALTSFEKQVSQTMSPCSRACSCDRED